ncbi:hypothetical protein A0O34_14935 [Chryseobacterium glaciei]|uniref:Uncharacterized protein n=1 Tax=Chryseobacterium glaciei TaxID=1685010 RepID=A0A172XXW3_9FLAO|nr:hypothetical protein [Chryseobacterium glaciei]ANF51720.1 hypothetical protein A0O34_14935 [Chryseobacterium glaciei]
MKYLLSSKILNRILSDNEFSLALSLHLKKKQDTVIRLAKRESDILRLPEQINFYKENGYQQEEIFDIVGEKSE